MQETEEPNDTQNKFSLKSSFRRPRHKNTAPAAASAGQIEDVTEPRGEEAAPPEPAPPTKPLVSIYSHRNEAHELIKNRPGKRSVTFSTAPDEVGYAAPKTFQRRYVKSNHKKKKDISSEGLYMMMNNPEVLKRLDNNEPAAEKPVPKPADQSTPDSDFGLRINQLDQVKISYFRPPLAGSFKGSSENGGSEGGSDSSESGSDEQKGEYVLGEEEHQDKLMDILSNGLDEDEEDDSFFSPPIIETNIDEVIHRAKMTEAVEAATPRRLKVTSLIEVPPSPPPAPAEGSDEGSVDSGIHEAGTDSPVEEPVVLPPTPPPPPPRPDRVPSPRPDREPLPVVEPVVVVQELPLLSPREEPTAAPAAAGGESESEEEEEESTSAESETSSLSSDTRPPSPEGHEMTYLQYEVEPIAPRYRREPRPKVESPKPTPKAATITSPKGSPAPSPRMPHSPRIDRSPKQRSPLVDDVFFRDTDFIPDPRRQAPKTARSIPQVSLENFFTPASSAPTPPQEDNSTSSSSTSSTSEWKEEMERKKREEEESIRALQRQKEIEEGRLRELQEQQAAAQRALANLAAAQQEEAARRRREQEELERRQVAEIERANEIQRAREARRAELIEIQRREMEDARRREEEARAAEERRAAEEERRRLREEERRREVEEERARLVQLEQLRLAEERDQERRQEEIRRKELELAEQRRLLQSQTQHDAPGNVVRSQPGTVTRTVSDEFDDIDSLLHDLMVSDPLIHQQKQQKKLQELEQELYQRQAREEAERRRAEEEEVQRLKEARERAEGDRVERERREKEAAEQRKQDELEAIRERKRRLREMPLEEVLALQKSKKGSPTPSVRSEVVPAAVMKRSSSESLNSITASLDRSGGAVGNAMIAPLSILNEIINPTVAEAMEEVDAAAEPTPLSPPEPPAATGDQRGRTLPVIVDRQLVPSPSIPPRTDRQRQEVPPPVQLRSEVPPPVPQSSQNSLLEPYVINATLETVPGGTPAKPPPVINRPVALSPNSQRAKEQQQWLDIDALLSDVTLLDSKPPVPARQVTPKGSPRTPPRGSPRPAAAVYQIRDSPPVPPREPPQPFRDVQREPPPRETYRELPSRDPPRPREAWRDTRDTSRREPAPAAAAPEPVRSAFRNVQGLPNPHEENLRRRSSIDDLQRRTLQLQRNQALTSSFRPVYTHNSGTMPTNVTVPYYQQQRMYQRPSATSPPPPTSPPLPAHGQFSQSFSGQGNYQGRPPPPAPRRPPGGGGGHTVV